MSYGIITHPNSSRHWPAEVSVAAAAAYDANAGHVASAAAGVAAVGTNYRRGRAAAAHSAAA